jgi:hypothetical protein
LTILSAKKPKRQADLDQDTVKRWMELADTAVGAAEKSKAA